MRLSALLAAGAGVLAFPGDFGCSTTLVNGLRMASAALILLFVASRSRIFLVIVRRAQIRK
jgi:hypothetical protein